ncbi:hypothetical protein LXA43DRAFT_898621 [Ganoderma leucocontextum]|nr:hypothetical protein LXA43DRAFT_898621 [Ganoderma leucocontextum]
MRTFTRNTLLTTILSALAVTRASTVVRRDGVVVWSNHGTTEAPAQGTAIAPGEAFPFSYREANMCKDDAVKVSSYLSREPPTATDVMPEGQLAPGSFVYHFGDWTVSNWGLPSNNPPPQTLVMPVLTDTPGPGTPMWFSVLENYAHCPPHGQSNWFGLATTQVVYN